MIEITQSACPDTCRDHPERMRSFPIISWRARHRLQSAFIEFGTARLLRPSRSFLMILTPFLFCFHLIQPLFPRYHPLSRATIPDRFASRPHIRFGRKRIPFSCTCPFCFRSYPRSFLLPMHPYPRPLGLYFHSSMFYIIG